MNCEIHLPGVPLSEPELRAFEERHCVLLPQDYRRFMLEHNGGVPVPNMFVTKDGFEVQVGNLYHIGGSLPIDPGRQDIRPEFRQEEPWKQWVSDLDEQCSSLDWEEAYGKGILQIGADFGGSSLFLCTKAFAGRIYFLDREETLRPAEGIVRVADSFTELMDGLREL